MAKKIILEQFVREVVKDVFQNLQEWENGDEDYRESYDVESRSTIYFNPETLEIVRRSPDAAFIMVFSNDFPDAYAEPSYTDDPADAVKDTGKCGGDYEITDAYIPDEYDENETIARFIEKNEQYILDVLTEDAEFV